MYKQISRTNKKLAIEQGKRTYISETPCITCGDLEKLVINSGCFLCSKKQGMVKLNDPILMASYRTKEKTNKRLVRWRKNNPEKLKQQRQRVSVKQTYYQRTRKARQRNQIPIDGDKNKILEYYIEAARRTKETGVPYEVDHIIPIAKGGLHHQNNLQVITREENRRKGSRI